MHSPLDADSLWKDNRPADYILDSNKVQIHFTYFIYIQRSFIILLIFFAAYSN
jgi:hypothetical protein